MQQTSRAVRKRIMDETGGKMILHLTVSLLIYKHS
jgi:hypothetical protein